MLLVGLAAFYLGYGVFFYGVEYALGNPLTLGDALLPWRLAQLRKDMGFLPKNAQPAPAGGSASSPSAPNPFAGTSASGSAPVTQSQGFLPPFAA